MNTKHFILAVFSVAFSACVQMENPAYSDTPIALKYSTVNAVETKAAQDLNEGTFASGENVMVRISNTGAGEWTDYTFTTGDAGAMTPPTPGPYYPAGSQNIDIVAYYPASAGTSFSVATDQTADASYKASDLMFASVTNQAKQSTPVNLAFAHKMAKLSVNITAGEGVTSITGISVLNVKPTVSFNQATGVVGAASGEATSIVMSNNGSAIIPAQTITGGLLSIVTDKGTAIYSVTDKAFAAGQLYTINITVNLRAVGTTTEITGWTSEGTVNVIPSDWTVSVSGTYTYNGSAIVPDAANITVHSTSAAADIDAANYNVYIENNINAGEASLVVYGKGTYVGEFAYCTFTINKAAGSVSYSTTLVEKALSDANFTNPLTKVGDGTVTYSSSDPSVATVNPSTGEVTIAATGTATITATPAESSNYTYATTASYTLTITGITTLAALKNYINAGHDGSSYLGYEVNSAGNIAVSSVSGTKIGYVAYISASNVDTGVDGSRILVVASADAAYSFDTSGNTAIRWGSRGTIRNMNDGMCGYSNTNTLQAYGESAHQAAYKAWNYDVTIPTGGSTPAHWFLPTKEQFNAMINALGGATAFTSKIGLTTLTGYITYYWTSIEGVGDDERKANSAVAFALSQGTTLQSQTRDKAANSVSSGVRTCFAY